MGPEEDAENPIKIDIANFSVSMSNKRPPGRPPPPKFGFLRRPIPVAPTSEKNTSVYTITPARHSIADFNLALKKQEPIFVHKPQPKERIWLRRALIAGGAFLMLIICLIILLEVLNGDRKNGANRQTH